MVRLEILEEYKRIRFSICINKKGRDYPGFFVRSYSIIRFFPKQNLERPVLSVNHPIAKHPVTVKITAVHIKHKPDGSKEKKGIKSLARMVKIGEKIRMMSVFLPMK